MNSNKSFRILNLAVLCSLVVSILSPVAAVGAAPPARVAQQSQPFIIRGQIRDILYNDGGPHWNEVEVFVSYYDPDSGDYLGTSPLLGPNRDGNWEFDERNLPSEVQPLPDTVTFHVKLPPKRGVGPLLSEEVVPIEAQAGAGGTVMAADHIVLKRVSRGTYEGNIFYTDSSGLYTTLAGCPIESIVTNETEHFAIRWCNDQNHPSRPQDNNYITDLEQALECAWDGIVERSAGCSVPYVASPLGYAPPEPPKFNGRRIRDDDRIVVEVFNLAFARN